jgi:2-amino-4-hydroxy-6-hydroxymethyldihydropteridine diphosphokinase
LTKFAQKTGMARVYLSLGSNKGNRTDHLSVALKNLLHFCKLNTLSNIYETQSWGYEGSDFLNLACCIETDLFAEELLKRLKEVEVLVGREKQVSKGYSDRVIDIDILFYDSLVFTSKSLCIPHPLLHLRIFCIQPLMDIAPDYIHPVFNFTISEIHSKQTSVEYDKISLFLKSEQFREKYSL